MALEHTHEVTNIMRTMLYLLFSTGCGEALIPNFALRSAASFWVLYSILFCSKLESFKYSSRELARDTGA